VTVKQTIGVSKAVNLYNKLVDVSLFAYILASLALEYSVISRWSVLSVEGMKTMEDY
jgi:hypothetical protein